MLSVIPNLITGLRFILVIPISVFIYQGNYFTALVLFIVAGLSDGLDGYLARRFNWTSEFGQFADPLADKCLILATLLALAFSERLPLWFVYTMLTRDGLILIGSISLILMQATIHVGVNIRLFPTTGMTLPFLSYGGSSIISTSILAGIILNLTKRKIT